MVRTCGRRTVDASRALRSARFVQYYTAFLAALAEGLAGAGQVVQGLAAADEALMRSDKSEERWIFPELLQLKGELVLLQTSPNTAAVAEDHFQQSLEMARRQGALALGAADLDEPGPALAPTAQDTPGAEATGAPLSPLH